ncbi:hypothetical protein MATL_G00192990 [Megalops atlanticus]|uniref:Uncharacterized protein n=1 Tax=Megalops atlanticus TaxID=7932 RepID=A0A9D3T0Q2_MEGAT|nr:hypothetical protein MATL_G00192990 [Megalops atlanticus]
MGEMGTDEKLMEKCWRPEDTKQTKITQYMKKRKKTWSLEAAKDTLHTWLPSEERQLHSPPRKKRLVEKEYCDILTKTTVLLSQPEDLTEDLKRMTLWQDCMKSLTERFQAAKQSEITRYLQPSASTTKTPTVQVKEEITVQSKPSAWETMISTVQMEEDTTDQVPNEKENQREIHRKKDRKKRPSMKMSDMETLHKLSMSVCQVHFCAYGVTDNQAASRTA